jgi:tRNA dimethylallyltransferase
MVSETLKYKNLPRSMAVMGATATGKSDLAIQLAGRFGGEIISMDSRQVYRGFDIGTAKVPPEEQGGIPHHMFDILDPSEPGSAGAHVAQALELAAGIRDRGGVPVFVGGTGLYFRALFRGLADLSLPRDKLEEVRRSFQPLDTMALYAELQQSDPDRAAELSPNDRIRISRALEVIRITGKPMSEHFDRQDPVEAWDGPKWVLSAPRETLRARIAGRTRQMYEAGWIEEVKRLLTEGIGLDDPAMNSLGYGEIARALQAGQDPNSTVERVITVTCQYAKRQETFFRSEKDAVWFDVSSAGYQRAIDEAINALT